MSDGGIYQFGDRDRKKKKKEDLRTDEMKVQFLRKGRRKGHYLFRVVDYSTLDLEWMDLAPAVGGAKPDVKMLRDLPFAGEWDVMNEIWPHVDKVHGQGGRCLVNIQVSRFPLLCCHVDGRDQLEVHPERDDEGADPFLNGVVSTWLRYDPALEVPAVLVNSNVPYVALKVFRKDAFGYKEKRIERKQTRFKTPNTEMALVAKETRFKMEGMEIVPLGKTDDAEYCLGFGPDTKMKIIRTTTFGYKEKRNEEREGEKLGSRKRRCKSSS
jgi:hypothetical protein